MYKKHLLLFCAIQHVLNTNLIGASGKKGINKIINNYLFV